MKSINFEFLRPERPLLADLGGSTETYAHSDLLRALVKVRVFLEAVMDYLYSRHALRPAPDGSLPWSRIWRSLRSVIPILAHW